MYKLTKNGTEFEIRAVEKGIFRVRVSSNGEYTESLLSRYNILRESGEADAVLSGDTVSLDGVSVTVCDGGLTLGGAKVPVKFTFDGFEGKPYKNRGFTLNVSLTDDERLFGLGDESRKSIARRGSVARLDVRNVASYGPMPFIMSSAGWGMLLNCTYASTFDCGAADKNLLTIKAHKGQLDFYLFVPESGALTDILTLQGKITGNPILLPKFAYGYTFVLNEQTNAREMLYDCLNFRREDISCDMVGLEPQWMTQHYDRSIYKKWDEDRFYIPGWLPDNQSGPDTFFYTLREMGFKFSLWLCQDYDLLFEEERQCGERAKELGKEYSFEGASILDPHLACPEYMDGLTQRDIPWFDHLKKFCDNGASAFKLDAAFQSNDHPDRLWGGKYFDDEVHNVYPVIYTKQMQEGFTGHTGRRAVIYTSCLYSGTQRYAASWAGDTGGGYDTVVAMLNYGLSGHSNVTCDMEVISKEGIHYGFLSPWTQQLGWRNWQQPWFLREELYEAVKYYSHLRNSLFPYIYSMAHKAAETALPMTRALSLMYPDRPEYDYVTNSYMFGDSLLVAVFDMKVTLPEGKWIDYFTGDVYEGGRVIDYVIPEGRGGALMVKAGSVFCTMDYQKYIEKKIPDNYHINVYPGGDGEFTLYEDDGYTYDYMEGKMATTKIEVKSKGEKSFDLTVYKREGSFDGRQKTAESLPSDP
ncbi:MAG: glycoside hydrolase family 31 protein, partial [Clostridia bacterium]|nr:glycoside hydrolase family 31 protein [Clostridia bacterium]